LNNDLKTDIYTLHPKQLLIINNIKIKFTQSEFQAN